MASTAILLANSKYINENDLDCCLSDLDAINQLVLATGRFSKIEKRANLDADEMRSVVRIALESQEPIEEIMFYFSGHGAQINSEFYFCGTSFDSTRPNETGFSHNDLHGLFRANDPGLLVKIIDACASGTQLIKSSAFNVPIKKEGFRNVIQLASCLSDQASWGGEPLSEFTNAFCAACLRRETGPIYYGDISNTLRDDFLTNEDQTPFFVSQGTGREILIEDASKLDTFKKYYNGLKIIKNQRDTLESNGAVLVAEPTAKQLLEEAESRAATPEKANNLIAKIFDGVKTRVQAGEFGELFELKSVEHDDFSENTAHEFIVRTLAREVRPDNFVTATIRRVPRKQDPLNLVSAMVAAQYDTKEEMELHLNCTLPRAQMRLTFQPLYQSLQQLVLVLTCAPSLEICYVFEILTRHARSDWDSFSYGGKEMVKRWYKLTWDHDVTDLINKIGNTFEDSVREHIKDSSERIVKNS